MGLAQATDYFVRETHILSSMCIACGTTHEVHYAADGEADSSGKPVGQDSIHDLASLTKLFTGLLSYRLMEEGLLDFKRPVTDYAPEFRALSDVPVSRVLGFEIGLITPQRVDAQKDRQAALEMLRRISPRDIGDARAYSDMHAMVMKYVLEGAAQQTYMDALRSRILMPLQMERTFCTVPPGLVPDCINYNGEHRIEKDRWILRNDVQPGTPHDPKARILMAEDDCPGHAGLFAAIGDIVKLARGVLDGKIVSKASLADMSRNRTGRRTQDGGWTQFLGSLCYVKHPELYHSEVPTYMGERAIALSGFTGHHLSIDPERGIFACFLGNRVRDRLTVLLPQEGLNRTDYGLNADGSGSMVWRDGHRIWSSVDYVHQKDQHFHTYVQMQLGI